MEKKEDSAVAMATKMGSKPEESGTNWSFLDQIDFAKTLENSGEQSNIDQSTWKKIFIQVGLGEIINVLETGIDKLIKQVVEQNTSELLRKKFGKCQFLLAMPTFMRLCGMEINAKTDLKQEALLTSQLWEQLKSSLFYTIQFLLAEQINSIEEKNKAYQTALDKTEQEAAEIPGLAGIMSDVKKQFLEKINDGKKKKTDLIEIFNNIGSGFVTSIENVFGTTVFAASHQSIEPSPIV
jgi:hypothetical protein